MVNTKVLAKMKDGSIREISISPIESQKLRGIADAIEVAKKTMRADEVENVRSWEVEDNLL